MKRKVLAFVISIFLIYQLLVPAYASETAVTTAVEKIPVVMIAAATNKITAQTNTPTTVPTPMGRNILVAGEISLRVRIPFPPRQKSGNIPIFQHLRK